MKTTTQLEQVQPAAIMLDHSEMSLVIAFRLMPDRQKGEMLNAMWSVALAFGENINPVMRAGGAK